MSNHIKRPITTQTRDNFSQNMEVRVSSMRRRLASSRFARGAALPVRVAAASRHNARTISATTKWLATSREHTNFTYDLTPLNWNHLAWWVAGTTGISVGDASALIAEARDDVTLIEHVQAMTRASTRRGLADDTVRLHKRAGWYALVRALCPDVVVETGTDKGLGSVVIAAALKRNGRGRLLTIDINNDSGYLIAGPYAEVVERQIGDSIYVLSGLGHQVDIFIHDSLHTKEHELQEYRAVVPHLTLGSVVLSDNAHATDALPAWAEETGRDFSYFAERPANHWYAGGGIGAAQFGKRPDTATVQ